MCIVYVQYKSLSTNYVFLDLMDFQCVLCSPRIMAHEEKANSCGTICLKYLLFTFNLLLWVSLFYCIDSNDKIACKNALVLNLRDNHV